jgi:hypothetical protein
MMMLYPQIAKDPKDVRASSVIRLVESDDISVLLLF